MIDLFNYPALRQFLTTSRCPPWGCSECPLSSNPKDVNDADPDEGYYTCGLLNRRVWGEEPLCKPDDWQQEALKELEGLLSNV